MGVERSPGGFGDKLRAARERRGISLRQIANTTKISVAALEALERNDIARLPGGIFSRAFVRSYAIEVGLDPESTIQEFIAQFPNDSVTAGHPTSRKPDDDDKVESERRMATAFLKIVALSVPVIALLIYVGVVGRKARLQRASPAAPIQADATPGTSATTGAAADAAGSATASATQFLVVISASGRSFVSATVDGLHTFDREMQAGEHAELTVKREVVLTAADAGVVALTLDGVEAKALGKAGEPATVRLNSDNFKDYLVSR